MNAGFKCFRGEAVPDLVPKVSRFGKGFDSELLLLSVLSCEAKKAETGMELPGLCADLSVTPMLFIEDSPMSNSNYEAAGTHQSDEDFFEQMRDIAKLHREYVHVHNPTAPASAHHDDSIPQLLLALIDDLDQGSYSAMVRGISDRYSARLPLYFEFSCQELRQFAGLD